MQGFAQFGGRLSQSAVSEDDWHKMSPEARDVWLWVCVDADGRSLGRTVGEKSPFHSLTLESALNGA